MARRDKRRGRRQRRSELSGQFVRGFVATGLLAALEARRAHTALAPRPLLRQALHGGVALAAGAAAADALERGRYAGALLSVAAGAAAMTGVECALAPTSEQPSPGELL